MKIFCIGLPKTGTTSMQALGRLLGYKVANQQEAERIFVGAAFNVTPSLLKSYCDKYDFFQDIPFCIPSVRKTILDLYPTAKFVLTVRSDPETWYSSVCRFYAYICNTKQVPTYNDMEKKNFHARPLSEFISWAFDGLDRHDPFNKERLLEYYTRSNKNAEDVIPPAQLITIDVSNNSHLGALFSFLDVKSDIAVFPHENKTPGSIRF